ncbi:hypothetical protein PsYK624_090580 [Phanerochaete sordida]|uniref:Transmembrane protein n=1 Tax=Phanerochaete sordida TaxID=48140 RepID=A0A9P3GDR4_9APHY|nr:hypothetical protein PsYK624_090580 [Phanerochaete sordida]
MNARNRNILFFSLNAVRAISIISLLLLFASTIVTVVFDVRAVNAFIAAGEVEPSMVGNPDASCDDGECDYIENSTVPNQPAGATWAMINWMLVLWQVVVCLLSEVGWPQALFTHFFPVLGREFGLGALGVVQCLLGAAVLSHHIPELMLVAAFLVFSVGCLHIVLGLVFRERAKRYRHVRSWREADQDVLPTNAAPSAMYAGRSPAGYPFEKGAARSGSLSSDKSGLGFGRQGEKWAEARGYVVQEPEEAVPPYASKPSSHASHSSGSQYSGESRPASAIGHDPEHDHRSEDDEDDDQHAH